MKSLDDEEPLLVRLLIRNFQEFIQWFSKLLMSKIDVCCIPYRSQTQANTQIPAMEWQDGPLWGSSFPRSQLKLSLNPLIPTVYTGQSGSRSYNFVLAHFLSLEGPFRRVMIFLTSIDLNPLKSVVTVRREFISFHQNYDIVHLEDFKVLHE